jgi:hypothetical protein
MNPESNLKTPIHKSRYLPVGDSNIQAASSRDFENNEISQLKTASLWNHSRTL